MFNLFKRKGRRRLANGSTDDDYAQLLRPSTSSNASTSNEEAHYESKVSGESRRFMVWGALLGVLVILVAIVSLIVVNTTALDPYAYERYDPRTKRCGTTAAEAKRLGCHFDPIAFSWLPDDCLDHELMSEFRMTGWTLYADKNKTTTLSEKAWSGEEMHGGEGGKHHHGMHQAWLTSKDSKLHCIFSWKRMHRAIMAGRNLPENLSLWANTKHCADILEAHLNPEEIVLDIHAGFSAC
ncbi:uncharacterized protein PpBr36_10617 [Pyricularia pennisetigena]|uniref:uncharacterized protein n=1 Tax=Pyricularia pennisetigena TaxID=1578925 RepID=UPI001154BB3B|nr:uncharacterized protein PpBr36_10617 [Pyricularia pennisetigena]TLS21273.1 hypothetical protein PpBr36_10617 [Pyricularia pennisetigena]